MYMYIYLYNCMYNYVSRRAISLNGNHQYRIKTTNKKVVSRMIATNRTSLTRYLSLFVTYSTDGVRWESYNQQLLFIIVSADGQCPLNIVMKLLTR